MGVTDKPESPSSASPTPGDTAAQGGGESRLSRWSREYRDNDAIWMGYHLLERSADRLRAKPLQRFFWRRTKARELARGLPGTNTPEQNRAVWDNYDWSEQGEEWSESPEWQEALIEHLLLPKIGDDNPSTLEIGPGAGRWTVVLAERSRQLVVVDVSQRALDLTREKLGPRDDVSYVLTEGNELPGVADDSVEFVWSFDVFVHIAPDDQANYLREFARVMKPGARGVIHHAGKGAVHPDSWRSSQTAEQFAKMLADNGLKLVDQIDGWGPDGAYKVPTIGDVVSIFER
jgi:ubiquinone/menaquinone biosynthesis C-methylase UbiE